MLKYETACVTAPGMDCAEFTPYSELHFKVKELGQFQKACLWCVSLPAALGATPGNNCGRGRNLKED